MLFNSLEFPVFLLLVLLAHGILGRTATWRGHKVFLVAASYLFYMSWSPFFGLLLLFSTLLDYGVGRALERVEAARGRRALVGASLVGNLGVLGYFKYGTFAAENAYWLLGSWNLLAPPLGDVLLPVGISFYTFQSLSYTIDVYRRRQRATRHLIDFALYVAFFPQLVAGPIVRAAELLPQLVRRPVAAPRDVEMALTRIATGFVKKVVLADTLGAYADLVFGHPGVYRGVGLLLGTYCYAFQIYCDFSGYCDVAIGVARLFGIRLPENFDRPYLAASPREFWRRWHITLSTWLRDYLYVSLGGNRAPRLRVYGNLVLTMALGGLWHGAAWTFVVWGVYHGLLLVLERLCTAGRELRPRGAALVLARVATFHLVCLGWVLFRAPSLADAVGMLGRLWSTDLFPSQTAGQALVALAVAVVLHTGPSASTLRTRFVRLPPGWQGLGYAALAVLVFLFSPTTGRFIYFQF